MSTIIRHALFVAMAACAAARADITYVSGSQTSIGFVEAFGSNPTQDSYNLAAPNPLASWNPPDQNISAVADAFSSATLQTHYSSILLPQHLELDMHLLHGITASVREGADFDFTQTFSSTFTIDAPMPVDISASMFALGQFSPTDPLTLSFGRQGDAPIVNLQTQSIQMPRTFPLTSMVLAPGTYTLMATQHNSAGSGLTSINYMQQITFTLVPSPCTLVALLAGVALGRRRTRPSRWIVPSREQRRT
jgi:hypothetical protein